MQKHNVILKVNLNDSLVEKLHNAFNVFDLRGDKQWKESLANLGEKVDGMLTNTGDGASADVIDALPNLKIVSCNGIGYDAVDVKKCLQRNIVVTHTPGVLDADTANTTLMMLLAISRKIIRNNRWVENDDWKNKGPAPLTDSIESKKVGIVGMGRIGQRIAHKLSVFNCDVSYHCRNPKPTLSYMYFDNVLELAEYVDYLIVIVPGGASTRHMINKDVLEALGKTGTLINVARGSVVDQHALVEAITNKTLGAAALDVYANEPEVPEKLKGLDNVLMLPHIGSATHETRHAMGELAIDNMIQFFKDGSTKTSIPECQ